MIKTSPTNLVIGTTNEGKIREIEVALGGLPLRLRLLSEFGELQVVTEIGATYEENATLKAVHYSRQTGLHVLADDSGLEVDVLGRWPGINSARYWGGGLSDFERTAKLLLDLEGFETSRRSARYISVMALAAPVSDDGLSATLLNVTSGICEGRIARTLCGSNGFGYDPVFIPEGYEETFGELPPVVKHRISHRAQALVQMRKFIEAFIGKLDHVCDAS